MALSLVMTLLSLNANAKSYDEGFAADTVSTAADGFDYEGDSLFSVADSVINEKAVAADTAAVATYPYGGAAGQSGQRLQLRSLQRQRRPYTPLPRSRMADSGRRGSLRRNMRERFVGKESARESAQHVLAERTEQDIHRQLHAVRPGCADARTGTLRRERTARLQGSRHHNDDVLRNDGSGGECG